ncbi:hypothetical protein V8E55_004201 [Tylopilus felleus]
MAYHILAQDFDHVFAVYLPPSLHWMFEFILAKPASFLAEPKRVNATMPRQGTNELDGAFYGFSAYRALDEHPESLWLRARIEAGSLDVHPSLLPMALLPMAPHAVSLFCAQRNRITTGGINHIISAILGSRFFINSIAWKRYIATGHGRFLYLLCNADLRGFYNIFPQNNGHTTCCFLSLGRTCDVSVHIILVCNGDILFGIKSAPFYILGSRVEWHKIGQSLRERIYSKSEERYQWNASNKPIAFYPVNGQDLYWYQNKAILHQVGVESGAKTTESEPFFLAKERYRALHQVGTERWFGNRV